jgi:hypothetical protein
MCEHSRRGLFLARPEPSEGVGHFIVSSKDMMELKTVELFLQPPNLHSICHHARVAVVRLFHDLVDDELRVTTDVKPLNPKLDGDA